MAFGTEKAEEELGPGCLPRLHPILSGSSTMRFGSASQARCHQGDEGPKTAALSMSKIAFLPETYQKQVEIEKRGVLLSWKSQFCFFFWSNLKI